MSLLLSLDDDLDRPWPHHCAAKKWAAQNLCNPAACIFPNWAERADFGVAGFISDCFNC
jgi:hypothetical protein